MSETENTREVLMKAVSVRKKVNSQKFLIGKIYVGTK